MISLTSSETMPMRWSIYLLVLLLLGGCIATALGLIYFAQLLSAVLIAGFFALLVRGLRAPSERAPR
jgi:hypothetical protein